MISVKKDSVTKPNVLNDKWINEKLLEIKDNSSPGKCITTKYNDDEVRNTLDQLYHNKCGYCEVKISAGFSARIDHFRPKDKIKVDKKMLENHKGYFWLGYEWTNLIPTCEKCNNKKSNQFPLKDENSRISDNLEKEGFLKNNELIIENFNIHKLNKEQRLLLNPEIDDINKHFYFLPTGEIKHLTKEGEKTIEVYDLNRSSLIFERKKIVDEIIRELISIFVRYDEFSVRLDEFFDVRLKSNKELEYSRFRFFINEFFNFFIIDKFEELGLIELSKILKKRH
jgi:uncharacterized protein (TIGR02646 family)